VLNPSEAQKEFEAITFAEGEVLGIDILVMNENDIFGGQTRATPDVRTTSAARPVYSNSPASMSACARSPLRSIMTHFPRSKIRPTTH